MSDIDELSHIIDLLDDDSEDVREAIASKLSQYGPSLKDQIEKLDSPPTTEQRRVLQSLMEDQSRKRLQTVWPNWVEFQNETEKFEEGYRILADYQTGYLYSDSMESLLDGYAKDFRSNYETNDPVALGEYLFSERGFSGNEDDYYNPLNSNLHYVAQEKKGIPITLTALFKLVADRLDMQVEGCNFPGHFLARAHRDHETLMIDCFNGGRVLDRQQLIRQARKVLDNRSIQRMLDFELSAEDWFKRILRNRSNAYRRNQDLRRATLMAMLRKYMNRYDHRTCDPVPVTKDYFAELQPSYVIGQIVRHHRDEFRGVIVDFDLNCSGTESWYRSERPRPYREQPWYVVLLDGSDESSYVAESVLRPDSTRNQVRNDRVDEYFHTYKDPYYVRNERSWVEPRP